MNFTLHFPEKQNQATRFLRWTILFFLLTSIVACGFHLRGVSEFPFKSIYVTGSESTPFGFTLRRDLKSQKNLRLVQEASEAEVTLQILSERPEKVILSLSVQGLVREYRLNSYLTFQVVSRDGKTLLPSTTIVLHRVITYNENVVLSKAAEEAMLYKDMQADLVQQVMRRLAALKIDPVDSTQ